MLVWSTDRAKEKFQSERVETVRWIYQFVPIADAVWN